MDGKKFTDEQMQEIIARATKYIREDNMGYVEALKKAENEVLEERINKKYSTCK